MLNENVLAVMWMMQQDIGDLGTKSESAARWVLECIRPAEERKILKLYRRSGREFEINPIPERARV